MERVRVGRNQTLIGRLWCCSGEPEWNSVGANDVPRVLIIVHGLGDHSGRYEELAGELNQSGWHVLAFDLLGHGESPGRRGCIDSYDGVLNDIAHARAEMRARFPLAHQVLLGHSMGGNLAINYALRWREFGQLDDALSGLVLCAPVLAPREPLPRPAIFAAWLTGYLLRWISIRKPVSGKQLSRNQDRVARIKNDPLMHARISIYLATQVLSQGRWALDHCRELSLPTLVMNGSDDSLIDIVACEHASLRMGDTASHIQWPDMRHDLFHDIEREQPVAALLKWLEQFSR